MDEVVAERRSLRTGLGRAVVALLIVAAPVGVYLVPEEGPSYPKAWDPRVLELVHYVEQERGLRFTHPVDVEFLDDKAFRARMAPTKEESDAEKEDQQRYLGELRALGLVSGDPDLGEAQEELLSSSLVGLYRYEEKALYVRGEELTPYVRAVLVHELTHAVQDQHFDLAALEDKAPAGAEIATVALIEGDAQRVEQAWVRELSASERAEYAKGEEAAGDTADEAKDVPQVLQDLLAFPYVFGPTYLDSLLVRGNSAVDEAFRRPPQTEAQVVAPTEYGADYRPSEVGDPAIPRGGKRSHEPGAFGQFSLFEVLGTQLGQARAWEAVSGWAGDRYVSYKQGDRACLAIDVDSKDEGHAEALEAAFQAWRVGLPDVVLDRDGRRVSLTTCDPGKDVQRREVQPRAVEVLAARAQAIDYLVQEARLGFRRATCIADEVLSQLGAALFVKPEATPAEEQRAGLAFQRASESC